VPQPADGGPARRFPAGDGPGRRSPADGDATQSPLSPDGAPAL